MQKRTCPKCQAPMYLAGLPSSKAAIRNAAADLDRKTDPDQPIWTCSVLNCGHAEDTTDEERALFWFGYEMALHDLGRKLRAVVMLDGEATGCPIDITYRGRYAAVV